MCKRKTYTAAIILSSMLLFSLPVHAEDVSKLYDAYNKEYTYSVPEEITNTIQSYNNAKKFVTQYTYVISSEYDTEALRLEQVQIETLIQDIENDLISGYDKSQAELYELEDAYVYYCKRLEDIGKSLESYTVPMSDLNVNAVPSYSEYKDAVQKKDDLVSKLDIGVIKNEVPVQSMARLLEHSNEQTSYRVVDSTGALSPFNGEVKDVIYETDHSYTVVIDNFNNVISTVANLESVDVVPGDTVYQNQRIGYVLGSKVVFKLSLNNELVDVSQIFVEESLQ